MSVKCPSCGSKKIKHLNNAPSGIESTTKGYSGYKTGAAVGATVGTAIPVIGTVAGGVIGGVVGGLLAFGDSIPDNHLCLKCDRKWYK